MLAEICSLQDAEFTYDSLGSWQFIPFLIRSCGGGIFGSSCNQSVGYKLRVSSDTTDGNQFVLTGDSGSIPVNLAFTSTGGIAATLQPDILTTVFLGSINPSSVSLSVRRRAADATLLPGTYRGQFQLTLEAEPHCVFIFCRIAAPISVDFLIDITIAPMIRISGLEDLAIEANPTGITDADQTFCVYSQGGLPFRITADSGNGNGTFVLAGNFDQIEYQATVGSVAEGIQHPLVEAQPSAQSWPGEPSENCSASGENMRIGIHIPPGEIGDAAETSYTDTLTLTVTLE